MPTVETNAIYINVRRRHFTTRSAMESNMAGRQQEWGYAENDDYIGILRSNASSWRYFSRSKLFVPGEGVTEGVTVQATETVINEGGADRNTRIESDTRNNALFIDGQYGNAGLNTAAFPDWERATYTAWKIGNSAFALQYYGGDANGGYVSNAYYDETDGRWEYIAAARATRYYSDRARHYFESAGAGAAADDPITWIENLRMNNQGSIFNEGSTIQNFRVETDGEEYSLYGDGTTDNWGIGTGTPLQDLTGTAAFDLAGSGLHIHAAIADEECYLVIEGETPDNGAGPGAGIFLVNNDGAANDKTMSWECWDNGLTKFRSWNDNGTILMDDILNMDLGDGGIFMTKLKSGANQGAAGAAANELWVDTADQTIKLGT